MTIEDKPHARKEQKMHENKLNDIYYYYNLVFSFKNGNDIISYFTARKCTDLDNMIDYCYCWIDKFGDKYGEIIEIEIYEKKTDGYFLVYDNYNL